MTDHPSTFHGDPQNTGAIDWDDRAALHRVGDGRGVFDGSKALKHGTFSDIIKHLMMLPAEEREKYAIQKAGDRKYTAEEAVALADHPNFPRD
ncbi:hypothetical protein GRI38_05275 [Altererythrobacter aurantiacus]|uniref:Uncharacterized protein n=1 Tax=Parapontixanthobacter aurantiacus TaxID=1463599 RepID=A0A844ZE50_9SPHN|nr:hypothetical protein [Parapontixanthobacter aurantiacus]MXO85436.1 hypothetical protein [Parapontixanthobacter aurantiacus]